jgi:enoyl-CoA hydratase
MTDVLALTFPRPEVAVMTLNRPDRLNALTNELVAAITTTLRELGARRDIRAIVITGAGRGFCAGLDLAQPGDAGGGGGIPQAYEGQETFSGMIEAVRAARQPVIAAVNGPAAGAGFGLTLACDVRIASETAKFHVAAVKIGLSSGECGISYHLPRHIGSARAFEIMLTGRPIDAAEADRIGLVTRVVADGAALDSALETADAICANSPFAVWMTKKVMWENLDASFDQAIALENRTQILAIGTRDAKEAMRAFVEKRAPSFIGE